MAGKVKSIANVAMQQDWFSSDVKVYEVLIAIEEPPPGLKPGMSAEVTIFTDVHAEHVLAVPVQAIVRVPGTEMKYKVFVKTNAGMEEREVTVGISKFAADQLSDITYVGLPKIGATVTTGKDFGQIETFASRSGARFESLRATSFTVSPPYSATQKT